MNKKRIFRLFLAFATLSLGWACQSHSPSDALPAIVLKETAEMPDGFALENNLSLLQFDSSDTSALMVEVRKILVVDGRLFVMDNRLSRVFEFTEEGKFVRAFGKRGAGPGELMGLEDIIYDGEYLNLMDRHKRALFTLDGQWVRDEAKIGFAFTYSFPEVWVHYSDNLPNDVANSFNLITLSRADSSLVDSASLKRHTLSDIRIPSAGGFFAPFDNRVYALPGQDTLIYAITANGKMDPAYRIQYPEGHFAAMEKFIEEFEDLSQLAENPKSLSYLYAVRSLHVTERFLYFTWMGTEGLYLVQYDKTSNQTKLLPLGQLFKSENLKINSFVGMDGDKGLFTLEGMTPESIYDEFGVSIGDDFNPLIVAIKLP